MKTSLFIAGNFWLFTALVLFLGEKWERSEPTRYSFAGLGAWLSPESYSGLVYGCLFVAAVCFALFVRRPAASGPTAAVRD